MPGTLTAPATTNPATQSIASIGLIDASGDVFSDSIVKSGNFLASEVQTWATAYQAKSNASLYRISITQDWIGDADPDNALAEYRASVKNGINLLFKNLTTLKTQTPRLIAPVSSAMQGNQDIPLLTDLAALITAYQTLLVGYNLSSGQYTDRRERTNNPRIKA